MRKIMKKKSKNATEKMKIDKSDENKKSPNYYIKLYTYILRDLSENIKDRKDLSKSPLYNENEVKKALSRKKIHQLLKSY